jgi:transmembrane sensor
MLDTKAIEFLTQVHLKITAGDIISADVRAIYDDMLSKDPEAVRFIENLQKGVDLKQFRNDQAYFKSVKDQDFQKVFGYKRGTAKIVTLSTPRKIVFIALTLAAAAAIALLIVGYPFVKTTISSNRDAKNVIANTDFQPASKGAVLKLADGSIVALDSTVNGQVASQGGNQVVKSAGGQLIYDVKGKISDGFNRLTNTISTAKGQQYKVTLPDGSVVALNAGSSLTYFAGMGSLDTNRLVTLEGEAYFMVTPNKSVPFIVSANGVNTKVLGTHFNLSAYEAEPLAITLVEGSVRVSRGAASLLMKPGEQVLAKSLDGGLLLNRNVDQDEVLAWTKNAFDFNNQTLDQVMRQLSRWYNVDYELRGYFPDLVLASTERGIPLSRVLYRLKKIGVANFQMEGNKIIVTPFGK